MTSFAVLSLENHSSGTKRKRKQVATSSFRDEQTHPGMLSTLRYLYGLLQVVVTGYVQPHKTYKFIKALIFYCAGLNQKYSASKVMC